uniref:VWFA domain-containing protein n=1 Tax=Denticeps clupeoides TaxID=299321 RepID=A0AAY3ZU16_9TELE
KANVNVLSVSLGSLVDISKCEVPPKTLSRTPTEQFSHVVWTCEFCGTENALPGGARCFHRPPPGRDILYMDGNSDGDYENLEDMMVVFCVDISGSMSVTSEVFIDLSTHGHHNFLLQGVQNALQKALSFLLQRSPHRRVALVTFNDEVTVYGDSLSVPLSLRDWALLDYDHLREQGENFTTLHCIAESLQPLTKSVKEEHGATALGPAALISIAMASQYPGSKVIICTDGRANIGLGQLEQESAHVIVSVMTFEGEDCRLAEVGRLADLTGGRVSHFFRCQRNEVYYPYEEGDSHRVMRDVGNVTEGQEMTFQFAVKPDKVESFQRRDRIPFQLQLEFRTRDMHKRRPCGIGSRLPKKHFFTLSWVWAGSLNMSVLGVHCAQLCARLTMEGKIQEAQKQLQAQQDLLIDIRYVGQPAPKEESVYGNWISTMSMICEDLTAEDKVRRRLHAAHIVYGFLSIFFIYQISGSVPLSQLVHLSEISDNIVLVCRRAKPPNNPRNYTHQSRSVPQTSCSVQTVILL